MKQHPLSAAFPEMPEEDYQALLASVADIGVQNPITLLDGMVLDGWHRYNAAEAHGQTCPSVELADGVDPRTFVLAQNRARRHITAAQLAMAATAVYAWHPSNRPSNSALSAELTKTTAERAEIAGAGRRTIEQAKAVQRTGTPEVQEAVRRGDIGLPKAAKIAAMPAAEQAAAITQPLPKPAPVGEPVHAEPTDYTELDAAHDQISELQSELVLARMGDIPAEEKQQAAALIAELRAEVKTLSATLKAAYLSRDSLMAEVAQLKRQCQMNRKELDKLKVK